MPVTADSTLRPPLHRNHAETAFLVPARLTAVSNPNAEIQTLTHYVSALFKTLMFQAVVRILSLSFDNTAYTLARFIRKRDCHACAFSSPVEKDGACGCQARALHKTRFLRRAAPARPLPPKMPAWQRAAKKQKPTLFYLTLGVIYG